MTNGYDYDVIIAGGGPAGSSASIHLATAGARVLLLEQKKFPRHKLCGEFISPECLRHFRNLRVADRLFEAQPAEIKETVFYASTGRSVTVPSGWFHGNGVALGLSRAEMDEGLLRRASEAGVAVIENAQVTDVILEDVAVRGVIVKRNGSDSGFRAPITVDATGRARLLGRRAGERRTDRPQFVGFKAHLEDTRVTPGTCEIYFYPRGYGGLSTIEKGKSNLCFIAAARDVRTLGTDPERVMREIVCRNTRAARTLQGARAVSPWLAVSLESFGRHSLQPAHGLLAAGDAASFIDPFTGSGMLMALESGELLASVVAERLHELTDDKVVTEIGRRYRALYKRKFAARLGLCSALRRAAFTPLLAGLAIRFFGSSDMFRRRLTLATRVGS